MGDSPEKKTIRFDTIRFSTANRLTFYRASVDRAIINSGLSVCRPSVRPSQLNDCVEEQYSPLSKAYI